MSRTGYGKANGKLILIGEHAVTFEEPAIAIPFKSGVVEVSISSAPEKQPTIIKSDVFSGMLQKAPEHIHSLIHRFIDKFNIQESLHVNIQSNLPPSRGLGSSAAMAIAFIRAIYQYVDQPLSEETLKEEANWAEKIAHGKPSGIDTETIISGQPVWFQQGKVTLLPPLALDGYMLVIDTGIKGSTRQAVEDVHYLYQQDAKYVQIIEHIGSLVKEAKKAIENHDIETLSKLFNGCQYDLHSLTVSHELIDKIIKMSLAQGATAGKLTGGGRGGSLIILSRDKETLEKIEEKAFELGINQAWIEYLGGSTHEV